MLISEKIFSIKNFSEFENLALQIFRFQYRFNPVYKKYVDLIGVKPQNVKKITQIPFLPIELFKKYKIVSFFYRKPNYEFDEIFLSSGTTGMVRSKHFVYDISLYVKSFRKTFRKFFGSPSQYVIFALLPSYLERKGSSLIYMVADLIRNSEQASGFYLYDYENLLNNLEIQRKKGKKIILFGVSFALLDLAEKYPVKLNDVIIIETGGMKGRRKEITREQLHQILKKSFSAEKIYSEYGMTELLSQAYSLGDGIFQFPNWFYVLIRDINDPFSYVANRKIGGINIIDLANVLSCSFIETKDLGQKIDDENFRILGRFDNSDLRGCNLLLGEV